MSDPSTSNTLAQLVDNAIEAAMNGASDLVEADLITAWPWLGLPGIKQILELGLSYVDSFFYGQAADAATKIVIDLQTNEEASSVNAAFTQAQSAIASGDQGQIAASQAALEAAFASLIHSDGSVST